jgi:hypothetical protein
MLSKLIRGLLAALGLAGVLYGVSLLRFAGGGRRDVAQWEAWHGHGSDPMKLEAARSVVDPLLQIYGWGAIALGGVVALVVLFPWDRVFGAQSSSRNSSL